MKKNIAKIEEELKQLVTADIDKDNFIWDLLLVYGLPKASISRLKKGNLNLSKDYHGVVWKKKLHFKHSDSDNLHEKITQIASEVKHSERFVILTDFKDFLAIDTKTEDTLDCNINELYKHFDFFLPWAGIEKTQRHNENPADVKAAEKMAKLFDEIKKDNPSSTSENLHELNVFFTRLLFCYFAEDTNIFKDSEFTNAIASHTHEDGSDLQEFLRRLFDVLDTPNKERKDLPEYLDKFPYVNGGLFKEDVKLPEFSARSRRMILDSGDLDWKDINPDIFGSMIQAVVRGLEGDDNTKHYTSVPNIMKVINPLFLDELYEEYEKTIDNKNKANELLQRIYKLKIFDPACGSGNFLIIAYKELRKLEMKIFEDHKMLAFSGIKLSQFYGIELNETAHEVAMLSLWLTEHQMNVEFLEKFGQVNPTLPLKDAGNIVLGNACRIPWEDVCPKEKDDEIYILGNPPYLGARLQTSEQKGDMKYVLKNNYKSLDYIAPWFYLGTQYIKNINAAVAFVSTNSIIQGEQIDLMWSRIIDDLEIFFAYKTFTWKNNAKKQAGVFVVIIGLKNKTNIKKTIYDSETKLLVDFINPYLVGSRINVVKRRPKPISRLPLMEYGNMPLEGTHLRFSETERNCILKKENSDICKFIRPVIGGEEFLKNIKRYCFWIDDVDLEQAKKHDEISNRIEKVFQFRKAGGEVAKTLAHKSHQFRYRHQAKSNLLVVPCTSSERREYLVCGNFDNSYITLNSVQVIYDSPIWIFGLLSSKMHLVWLKTVGGRLKSDFRYSTALCYNNFPFPDISEQRKQEITQCVFRILEEREKHPDKTLAQLYDPDKMPQGLREAHKANDEVIEKCYRSKPFVSDEERLEYLFKLYEKMIAEEKEKDTLFEKPKKTRKRKKKEIK